MVRYIKLCPGQGLFFSKANNLNSLTIFCDSDWAGGVVTRKSISSYCIRLGDSALSWKAKKQAMVSRSNAEVEYRSKGLATSEVILVRGLLEELRIAFQNPTALYCDKKATIQIASNSMFHERTKRIEIDCHFVNERILDGTIIPEHINTKDQIVDLLTKPLYKQQHHCLMKCYGIKDMFQQKQQEGEGEAGENVEV